MEKEILKITGYIILTGMAVGLVVLPVLTAIITEFLYGTGKKHIEQRGNRQ
jgi:hypothetical protein